MPPEQLRGATKRSAERVHRPRYLAVSIEAALRLTADVIAYCAQEVPKFNPISVSGSHMQQAGATPVESVALAFTHALAYVDLLLARGLSIDDFAPRISWNLGVTGTDFFEEAARFRAARRLWARLMQERYQPRRQASCMLRFYAGSGGNTLTVEEPSTTSCVWRWKSWPRPSVGPRPFTPVPTMKAYAIPTEEAQLIALRTQQIIAYETGLTRTIDRLLGRTMSRPSPTLPNGRCGRSSTRSCRLASAGPLNPG